MSPACRKLVQRDGPCCWLCSQVVVVGQGPNQPYAPSKDHVVERRNGGKATLDNLRLAHRFCNQVRAASPNPIKHRRFSRRIEKPLRALGRWDDSARWKKLFFNDLTLNGTHGD